MNPKYTADVDVVVLCVFCLWGGGKYGRALGSSGGIYVGTYILLGHWVRPVVST